MALFDELMGAFKKALEEKAGPTLKKVAAVMDEFETGVEMARAHGQLLVQAAREAEKRAAAGRPPPVETEKRPAEQGSANIVDAEVVETEPQE